MLRWKSAGTFFLHHTAFQQDDSKFSDVEKGILKQAGIKKSDLPRDQESRRYVKSVVQQCIAEELAKQSPGDPRDLGSVLPVVVGPDADLAAQRRRELAPTSPSPGAASGKSAPPVPPVVTGKSAPPTAPTLSSPGKTAPPGKAAPPAKSAPPPPGKAPAGGKAAPPVPPKHGTPPPKPVAGAKPSAAPTSKAALFDAIRGKPVQLRKVAPPAEAGPAGRVVTGAGKQSPTAQQPPKTAASGQQALLAAIRGGPKLKPVAKSGVIDAAGAEAQASLDISVVPVGIKQQIQTNVAGTIKKALDARFAAAHGSEDEDGQSDLSEWSD
mmetsp:Transcript_63764/g.146687  ORF Transcript_63764/g.146687 Transcript_63764/m.146687 type:complete len:325 (+) Transcript_63764:683-1657(+)